MTLRQLERLRAADLCEPMALDLENPGGLVETAAGRLRSGRRVLIHSSAAPADRMTAPGAASRIEQAFGRVAAALRPLYGGVIVAGGETSGAVVEALGVRAAEVEAMLAPGVPALRAAGGDGLRMALKSGNFGGEDFFAEAIGYLEN
jgi:uncharacterized protein YgbK (DUF1537 family)